jgi:hypothetical protein
MIENVLKKCKRNANKPDLHSFTADFDGGKVYVHYAYDFNILLFRFSKNEDIREHYNFKLKETTDFLTKLNIKNISM